MLLWVEGFDQYGNTVNVAPDGMEEVYSSNDAVAEFRVREGRLAQYAMEFRSSSGATYVTTPNLGNITTFIVGIAFKPLSDLNNRLLISIREDDDSTQGLNVFLNSTGTVSVRLNTTVLQTTGGTVITADVWHYLEFKVTIHQTTGSYDFRINGVSQLSASGVDTRAGATNNYANRIRIQGDDTESIGQGHVFDDWYVCDDSGSVNNDFLGDRRVQTLFPNADGTTNDFTTANGGNNYEEVDDTDIDDDTTYVESGTSGHRDLYNFENLVAADEINGVMHSAILRKTDVTNFDVELILKSDEVIEEDDAQTVGSTSYAGFHVIYETDPNTTDPWEVAGVNAAEFGYDVG